ncbi:exodeoxyribonuclease III [Afifella marina]|uniref:Exodeoxyribonuclease-3 n=1 Tax=Afifella marina DSM 2698 TaxID=1120955 RepID=A0A1G5P7G8_AFIMA|nr:exodeoxyribonuclease III [Afifella marina]MBK1624899.1 exodeoxyribonuclease III [Afifella marina DSM 2698]MBK1628493.1 exodeoxyribonuclease III [Afifella marina]MBK5917980.1 exodeoxyribonuclease III [Afifella marina]RAI18684.1 exodeoxyribonuclease III [Afifella marina DSM 2698]SCZ45454.1 exodeoxyribonuclease-3 [Afifella marina DSM 2698]
MKIATWNINGVKARLDGLVTWLGEASPDVVCLQEIKSIDEAFPREPIEALGYNVATHGQKGFNGVAILSKRPLEDVTPRLSGDEDDVQARFLEAIVPDDHDGIVRVVSAYMPNGNPIGTEKFSYKLAWMERLEAWVDDRLALEEPFVLAGDFNIIPESIDARYPQRWTEDALFQPESRNAYRKLTARGLTEALRTVTDAGDIYTFWDYQAGAWQKNNGIRIDHLLLSPEAADRLAAVGIDKHVRAWEKPSDHVPVWIALS